jgi:hypothetical protein
MKDGRVKLSGLWKGEFSNGETYFTGSIGMSSVLITKNGYKEEESEPDYILWVRPKLKVQDRNITKEDPTDVIKKGGDKPF